MNIKQLIWEEEGRKKVFDSSIFSVWESYCKSPKLQSGQCELQVFTVIEANDWAITIPVINDSKGGQFIMVWQWRHGSRSLSLEFPGGVLESGENPKAAAIRELVEETGYYPGKIEKIGEFSPNPAIMSNKVHFFLAEELKDGGKQTLDANEYVEVALIDINDAIQGMGKEPYSHALMGTALSLYLKNRINL